MKAEIKGNSLHIEIPVIEPPRQSRSGKTFVLASSDGNKKVMIDDKPFYLNLNCYYYPKPLEE